MKFYGLNPEMSAIEDWCICGSETGEPKEWLYIGRLAEYGRRYNVKFDISKEKVIAIVGKRGQGKSYTLASLIEGLITANNPSSISSMNGNRAILVFDTLNIFQWMNIPLKSHAKYPEIEKQASLLTGWGVEPEILNVDIWVPAGYKYELTPPDYKDLFIDVSSFSVEDWGALLNLDIVRDIKGQFISETYQKVISIGWRDIKGNYFSPKPNYSIQDLINCIEHDEDKEESIFKPDTRRAVLQQLRSYAMHKTFSGNGTPLNEILKPGRAAVILLNRLPEDLRGVLVATMVRRVIQERAEASENIKDLLINPTLDKKLRLEKEKFVKNTIPKTWIVIDEAQNVIPSGRKTSATDSLIKLVKEGRNFGLSFAVTTQQPRSLDVNVLSQVETFIVHKLVSQIDIDFILENLKCPFPNQAKDDYATLTSKELLRDIEVGQAVVSDTNTMRCFVMEIRPRVSVHGGFEA
jgi:hypothetical protein